MRISLFLFIIIFYLLILPISHAGEVILYNGDKISGKIINKTDDVLVLKTSYAGTLKIAWNEVKSLSTDEPAHIVLQDGTNINETILANKTSGSSKIQQISEINPPIKPDFINKGQINFGLDIERGNSDVDDYHLDSETEFRWLHDRLSFELNGDLQDSSGRSSQQNTDFLADYDHF